jgi:hypothetical protein
MKLTKGSELPKLIQKQVLACFVHRFTKDHKPDWARRPRPDGTPYMVQFASDQDWLEHTEFYITNKGELSRRHKTCFSSPTWPDGKNYPMAKCNDPYKDTNESLAESNITNPYPCLEKATTERKDFRFGGEGEPAVVETTTPLCANCASRWDDNAGESAAEAMGS